jgi:hypothetical protein
MSVRLHALALAAACCAAPALAANSHFSNFTPLANSAGPTADEAVPLTLSSALFSQRSIADRTTQLAPLSSTVAAGT